MDRFSDFSATREIAAISVHYHNIRGGIGGGTASLLVKTLDLETIDIVVYTSFPTCHCSTVASRTVGANGPWRGR
jgi:transketolase C-terminal domain/subunit